MSARVFVAALLAFGFCVAGVRADDGLGGILDRSLKPATSCNGEPQIPHTDFARVVAAVGGTVENGKCRYKPDELAKLEVAAADPEAPLSDPDQYLGDWACLMVQDNFANDEMKGCM